MERRKRRIGKVKGRNERKRKKWKGKEGERMEKRWV